MTPVNNLEVEVKFLADDLALIRQQLLAAGAQLTKPRVYERNVRFDSADAVLLKKEEILRLREDTAVTLTFKGLSEFDQTSEAKVREEIEVLVDDFGQMAAIIQRLGFEPQQTYEKYRETFQLNDVEVVLDEMPYGNFVELEGGEAGIKAAAMQLGLKWDDRIQSNYLALMALLVERFDLPFEDITFANFRDSTLSVNDILPLPSST
jgi:adenylate cyclase, class 2